MIDKIELELKPYRELLVNHSLYKNLKNIDDVKKFMEMHVFAVWDFMSLVKKLQIELTCVQIPWIPTKDSGSARLINEIVWGEETDINENNIAKSHFEMYIEAMDEIGAETTTINHFVSGIKDLDNIANCIKKSDLNSSIKSFLNFSFVTIEGWKSHEIAAAFTFGREEIIPDMFIEIIEQTEKTNKVSLDKINYYLQRHIDLDGDEHGPLAHEMIIGLCKNDSKKWEEVANISKKALKERIQLWDFINHCIKHKNEPFNKIENPELANV